jgi:hypothetical protein
LENQLKLLAEPGPHEQCGPAHYTGLRHTQQWTSVRARPSSSHRAPKRLSPPARRAATVSTRRRPHVHRPCPYPLTQLLVEAKSLFAFATRFSHASASPHPVASASNATANELLGQAPLSCRPHALALLSTRTSFESPTAAPQGVSEVASSDAEASSSPAASGPSPSLPSLTRALPERQDPR